MIVLKHKGRVYSTRIYITETGVHNFYNYTLGNYDSYYKIHI